MRADRNSAPGAGPRLYVAAALGSGAAIELDRARAHYLRDVMRRGPGDAVRLFNGRDGEWAARIAATRKAGATLGVEARLRPQATGPDLWLVFAPVKRAAIDDLARKATELGAAVLWPMLTRHTAVGRVNTARLVANAVEAAEQCGRLDVPEVRAPARLDAALADWPAGRRLLLCDETGGGRPIGRALAKLDAAAERAPWAIMTGPEGGYARSELDALRKLPFVTSVGLGPRLLRAETAALAALACWQALVGDWGPPAAG